MNEEIQHLVDSLIPQARAEAWRTFNSARHATNRDELESIAYLGLMQAANRWPSYCLVPETLILRSDLSWAPIGEVVSGDMLVGVDDMPPGGSGQSRNYRKATVAETSRRVASCLRIWLDDGREVVCSRDHKWLLYRQFGYYRAHRTGSGVASKLSWWRADEIRVGDLMASPLRPWPEDRSYGAGWLSGIFDGEGCLSRSSFDFAQKEGAVLDKAKGLLTEMGIPYTLTLRKSDGCAHVSISVRRHALEAVGRLRPVRLLPKAEVLWADRKMYNRGPSTHVRVAAIEDAGVREVVTIETTTGTFLAEGLVSHNCEANGYDPGCGQVPCERPETCGTRWFGTYCLRRMRGAILDSQRSADWVPRTVRQNAKALRDAGEDTGVSERELSARTGLDEGVIRATRSAVAQRPVSINDESGHDVADSAGTESTVAASQILTAVVRAVRTLSVASQVIISMRYFEQRELRDCAEALGLKESVVSQLHQEGVIAVHRAMAESARETS